MGHRIFFLSVLQLNQFFTLDIFEINQKYWTQNYIRIFDEKYCQKTTRVGNETITVENNVSKIVQ